MLTYDSATGKLYWKIRPSRATPAGSEAGTVKDSGYIQVSYKNKSYLAHLIIWYIVKGEWPTQDIDHRNTIRSDNRIDNLRYSTDNENQWNKSMSRNNTSGYKGVSWHEKSGKWRADVVKHGKRVTVGYYRSRETANDVLRLVREILHGKFVNHGDEVEDLTDSKVFEGILALW